MTPFALRRGTVETVASAGVYAGKPWPGVGMQADRWLQAHPSVTRCPLTSTLLNAPSVRIAVRVLPTDGRQAVHQAVGEVVGQLEPQALVELDLGLRGWLELPRAGMVRTAGHRSSNGLLAGV